MTSSHAAKGAALINARKFDGSIHRSWNAELVEQSGSMLVFKGVFDRLIDHPEIGVIRPGTLSLEYYWLDRTYNVFRFSEPDGELKCLYCNVNLPPVFEEHTLDYIDLDVDILAFPDRPPVALDLEEFDSNSRLYGYPEDVVAVVRESTQELLKLLEVGEYPFSI